MSTLTHQEFQRMMEEYKELLRAPRIPTVVAVMGGKVITTTIQHPFAREHDEKVRQSDAFKTLEYLHACGDGEAPNET
jgi:hypothetical protein